MGPADQWQVVDEDEVDEVDDEAGQVADQRQQDQGFPAELVGQSWKQIDQSEELN